MKEQVVIFVDGGCSNNGRTNPDSPVVCYGSYKSITHKFERLRFPLPDASTNNQAEYLALITLLQDLEKSDFDVPIKIQVDSMILRNQVLGIYRINVPQLGVLATKARKLLASVKDRTGCQVTIDWVSGASMKHILSH